MNRDTLHAFRRLAVSGAVPTRTELPHLTAAEADL
jgi:hypothetical protein